jgi:hypothetical protein
VRAGRSQDGTVSEPVTSLDATRPCPLEVAW